MVFVYKNDYKPNYHPTHLIYFYFLTHKTTKERRKTMVNNL